MTDLRDPAVIREEIAETREELGQAVEALAAKTNVKTRAREKFADANRAARERPAIALGIAGVVVVALAVLRSR